MAVSEASRLRLNDKELPLLKQSSVFLQKKKKLKELQEKQIWEVAKDDIDFPYSKGLSRRIRLILENYLY